MSLLRYAAGAAVTAAVALAGAPPALAAHLQGGSLDAGVSATGYLQGTLVYAAVGTCTLGSPTTQQITLTAPTSETKNASVSMTATRCLPGSATYTGTFDIPLDTSTFPGGAPDGVYTVKWRSGNRVGGIVNLADSSMGYVSFETAVRKTAMQASSAPKFGSNAANGVAIGTAYSQNLNASDPDGGTVSFEARLKADDPDAPDTNIVNLSPAGQVTIPASVTAGFTGGQHYIYKVRVTDDQDEYSERDVLLKVASSNQAPKFEGLAANYYAPPGTHVSIPIRASDANSGDTVTVTGAALPEWATVNVTPGNPAVGTLEIDSPANGSGVVGINLDAVDDSTDVALTDSAFVTLTLAAAPDEADTTPPAAPVVLSGPSGMTSSTSARFTFSGEPGATFECRIDKRNWAPCTSPVAYKKLALGKHTFQVRQTDAAGNVSQAAVRGFTVASATVVVRATGSKAKATPVLARTVGTTSKSADVGCRVPGAKLTRCTIKAYAVVNGKRVLIGTGSANGAGKGSRLQVKVKLNARGRALVNRPGGVKATFRLNASTTSGSLNASTVARMLPATSFVVPGTSLFASNSGELTTKGRAYVRALAAQLRDAKALTCTGHTDAFGSPRSNVALGLKRARNTCALLRSLGIKAKLNVRSAGESRPRASNATEAGRALNRRVEITVSYR